MLSASLNEIFPSLLSSFIGQMHPILAYICKSDMFHHRYSVSLSEVNLQHMVITQCDFYLTMPVYRKHKTCVYICLWRSRNSVFSLKITGSRAHLHRH